MSPDQRKGSFSEDIASANAFCFYPVNKYSRVLFSSFPCAIPAFGYICCMEDQFAPAIVNVEFDFFKHSPMSYSKAII